ncbi:phosphotransferase family protein [Streptomyces reniochalinae]|uniref:Aminoglycoside phosphotransferase family protein n=1 Tax=Streptomyces reniochalinae TaxID=2250578 RepID=A0A367F1J0_9ACTN|nr:aminoglycoside phosphotransferase family protein [Streptomyces reniochalinae]RCG23799.1 aminoglycoside phosphotransferase family protein [Streptomyces reniochalinae]
MVSDGSDGGESSARVTEFTEESGGVVLREACSSAGLDSGGAELLRLGSNAVYRLSTAPVVVRIARDTEALEEMQRAVGVARWLETEDFPATRVLSDVEQPVLIRGRVVTYWENLQDEVEYARLDELADLLKRLHWLEEPKSLGLPYFDPFAKVWDSLRTLDSVADADRTFFEERAGELTKAYDRLDFVLPFGMIHGDANVGNCLRDRSGRAVLIDLDGFALAPREWDLVLTSLYYERFGWHTRAEYESFVHHYGFDLMNWPGYPVLADVRELMMTLWLGHQVTSSKESAEEFARRMKTLRSGASRADWKPF